MFEITIHKDGSLKLRQCQRGSGLSWPGKEINWLPVPVALKIPRSLFD